MKCYASFAMLILLTASAFADSPGYFDWPQWQGPDRNAISKETGLLQQWPENGPPLAWRLDDLGGGYGGPSIADGRIFGMSNRGDDEVVRIRRFSRSSPVEEVLNQAMELPGNLFQTRTSINVLVAYR